MTTAEKVEWAKRAFEEMAKECMEISDLEIVDRVERNTWRSMAAKARNNIKFLGQS